MFRTKTIRHIAKRSLISIGLYKHPSFLILGAQKAGTTYLYSVLRQHPQIIEPVDKEAHFFDYDDNYSKGSFQYKLNFDLSYRFRKDQITFEATPDYLAHKQSAKRVKEMLSNVKFIIILREPVQRSYSAWKMHHYKFKDDSRHSWLYDARSFEKVVFDALDGMDKWHLMNHIGRSLYGMQISNWLKFFNRENFLFLFSNSLQTDTQEQINRVTSFLGIDNFLLENLNTEDSRFWNNKSNIDSTIDVDPLVIKRLEKYYEGDKEILKTILNTSIPW